MEIVPVVDCAVPAENKPGGGGVTRVVLLLALLFGGSTDSLLIHLGNSVLISTVFLLVSPLSTMTKIAFKLWTALVFTLVLSFALVLAFLAFGVFAFLAFVSIHSVDFHWRFYHCR